MKKIIENLQVINDVINEYDNSSEVSLEQVRLYCALVDCVLEECQKEIDLTSSLKLDITVVLNKVKKYLQPKKETKEEN